MIAARLVLSLLACSLVGCAAAGPIEPGVEALLADYRQAIDARDAGALRACFVGDDRFAWHEDGSLRYATVDALVAASTQQPPAMAFETAYSDTHIVPLGDAHASVRTGFATKVKNGEATVFEFAGLMTVLVERRGGTWRIVSGHSSSHKQRG